MNRGDAVTAAAAAALCVVWIVWPSDLRGHYLDLFRSALKEGVVQARADLPALDLGSLEALFASLNSRDDPEVLAAMDLLVEQGRVRLIPALILYHPSPLVVRCAPSSTSPRSGRADFLPIADRLATHGDPEIRAAALRARTAVQGDEALLASRGATTRARSCKATALDRAHRHGVADRGRARGPAGDVRRPWRAARDRPGRRAGHPRGALARSSWTPLLRLVEAPDPEVQVARRRGHGPHRRRSLPARAAAPAGACARRAPAAARRS